MTRKARRKKKTRSKTMAQTSMVDQKYNMPLFWSSKPAKSGKAMQDKYGMFLGKQSPRFKSNTMNRAFGIRASQSPRLMIA